MFKVRPDQQVSTDQPDQPAQPVQLDRPDRPVFKVQPDLLVRLEPVVSKDPVGRLVQLVLRV